ncbi:MAG: hypothetical protein ACKVX7_09915 [Planctomycetota bacterium]
MHLFPSSRSTRSLRTVIVGCLACFATSCDRPAREHDHEHDGAHVHVAPHGGTLVPLGEEFANLELVLDSTRGTLTAFVLDGHAENALRVKQAELVLEVVLAESKAFEMRLPAVESALSGEKKGDSSQFQIVDARLAGVSQLRGQVLSLEVRGRPFVKVAFELKTPASAK